MDELEKLLEKQIPPQENLTQFTSINGPLELNSQLIKENLVEENKFIEEEMEGEEKEESEYELETNDTYQACALKIKNFYTIKTKSDKKDYIERYAYCKTKGCPSKAQLKQYGNSLASKTDLLFNQKSHLVDCKQNENLLYDQKIKEYLELGMKPKEAIRRFNKLGEAKIDNSRENCKKFSQLKWTLKQKEDKNRLDIINAFELEAWLKSKTYLNEEGNFDSLSWNTPFVANFKIQNDDFIALLTTKNCSHNFIKQASCDHLFICLDGTYKMNIPGFPTIVIGTCDLHRKFHFGNFNFKFNLIKLQKADLL